MLWLLLSDQNMNNWINTFFCVLCYIKVLINWSIITFESDYLNIFVKLTLYITQWIFCGSFMWRYDYFMIKKCNWYSLSICRGGDSGWHVFYHFVGAVPGSTDLEKCLKRLLTEINAVNVSRHHMGTPISPTNTHPPTHTHIPTTCLWNAWRD